MKNSLPIRLRKAPILEAVAEIQFASSVGNVASSVLPGLLFNDLKAQYPELQPHPSAQIPSEIKEKNPELRYLPSVVMSGAASSINIGGRVLGVSFLRPYPGWEHFKSAILGVWEVAQRSAVLGEIERFSIKYVNLIDAPLGSNQLDLTTVKVILGDHSITNESTTVRSQLRDGRFDIIVSVASQATTIGPETSTGLILDLDVICSGPFANSWGDVKELLEDAHSIEKRVFFSLVEDATIERYEPEY